MSLSRAQNQAITHNEGPCMVLAGPGSGKTLTLTKRIEYLIKNRHVKPGEILVITFTKAAANEMKKRFHNMMGANGAGVTFGTFHGIYYGILKWAYKRNAESILSESEKEQILKEVIEKEKIDDFDDLLKDVLSEISIVKNSKRDIKNYEAESCNSQMFRVIYKEYERKRQALQKLDFDDMLLETLRLFEERTDVLQLWQEKFRYILIDEFQDVNAVQYEVIKKLALPENNLFIVGDDDQSIYRFRGACPEIMLEFAKEYPDAKVIYLNENYRSTKAIVNSSARVIGNNKKRYEKQIQTFNAQGDTVHIQEVRNQIEEGEYIVKEIQKIRKRGVEARDIAVLFRSNTEARYLVETFIEKNIPFVMKEHSFNIYEHFIGRDIIAYCKLAQGDRSRKYFLAIANRPNRYIGRDAMDEPFVSFEELKKYYFDKEWMLDRIDQMEWDIRVMKKMAPYAAILYLRKSVGYDEFLKEYAVKHKINLEELMEILYEIEERAKQYKNMQEWFEHINEYSACLRQRDEHKKEERDAVRFMTMHGAKGLEYEVVFVVDVNEKVIPYKRAETVDEIEEERRLFYVAMTRAKRKLYVIYATEKNGKKLEPSRFVGELLKGTKWDK